MNKIKIILFDKNKEKGVSLLIAFLIMGISLSIVLGISAILISQIKVIKGVGNSVKAFYAADTGVEEVIYFDHKKLPENGKRGFCNICNVCRDFGCQNCLSSGSDCDPITCQNCQVSYQNKIGDKKYNIVSNVKQEEGEQNINSYGEYEKITRAIGLRFIIAGGEEGPQAPMIYNTSVVPRSVPEGIELEIVADIYDDDEVKDAKIHIQYPDETDVVVIPFFLYGNSKVTYKTTWIGPVGFYYVDITACDLLDNCSEKENI